MSDDAMLELVARVSMQGLLLEFLFANVFAEHPEKLDAVMGELQRVTRQAPVRAEPLQDEDAIEMQARVATHLQRFHEGVRRQVASARGRI